MSDKLSKYLNQTASWQDKSGRNGAAEPTFSAAATIAVRKESRYRLVRDVYGKEVVSSTTIFTKTAVAADDRIDGIPVINVFAMTRKDGTIEGYEAVL